MISIVQSTWLQVQYKYYNYSLRLKIIIDGFKNTFQIISAVSYFPEHTVLAQRSLAVKGKK